MQEKLPGIKYIKYLLIQKHQSISEQGDICTTVKVANQYNKAIVFSDLYGSLVRLNVM